MLSALNDAEVDYLVVGAYALAAYGNPRATGDLDIWVRPTSENADRVWEALRLFGIPKSWVKEPIELTDSNAVFSFGVPPERVDILTSITAIGFQNAWSNRKIAEYDGVSTPVLHWRDLLANKRATGRLKDAADAQWIETVMRGRGESI